MRFRRRSWPPTPPRWRRTCRGAPTPEPNQAHCRVVTGDARPRDFHITVLGRTLEHLGTQLYKQRTVALAELAANCWDAGATAVRISVPEPDDYDPASSVITVTDDGRGMTDDEVDNDYLVIG